MFDEAYHRADFDLFEDDLSVVDESELESERDCSPETAPRVDILPSVSHVQVKPNKLVAPLTFRRTPSTSPERASVMQEKYTARSRSSRKTTSSSAHRREHSLVAEVRIPGFASSHTMQTRTPASRLKGRTPSPDRFGRQRDWRDRHHADSRRQHRDHHHRPRRH